MEQVSPTRMELLIRKNQSELATQGMELLKEKMNALLKEFMSIMDKVMRSSEELDKVAADAQFSLTVAKAVDGDVSVNSASFATKGEIWLDVKGKNIMGVAIPHIEKKSVMRSVLARGYSIIGTSSRIDEAAEKYERELTSIIELAAVETTLRKLGDELRKTRRRVNALNHIIIPMLQEQIKYIEIVLEEREREDLFRLKKVKKAIEKKKGKIARAG